MKIAISMAVLWLALLGGRAHADPVDNPGFFAWDTGWGVLTFNQSAPLVATIPASSGTWQTDIAGNGDITMDALTLGPVNVQGYTVQVLVSAPFSTGNVNAAISGYNSSLNLTLRVRVSNAGTPQSCVTPPFTVAFDGFYQNLGGGSGGEFHFYTQNGGTETAGWVTVPLLPASCAQAAILNPLLGFGSPQQGLKIYRLRAVTPLGVFGS